MKGVLCWIFCVMGFLLIPGWGAARNDGPFIGLHPEGAAEEGARMVQPDVVNGQKVFFRISPEVSGRHFSTYEPFPAQDGNGMGVVLGLNEEGMRAMMVLCSTFQGKLLRIIVNGRPVDLVSVDRPPADRKVVILSGLTAEDFKLFDKSKKLKRLGVVTGKE